MAPIELRTNQAIGFTENGAFDPALLIYDPVYQASQEHSPAFKAHMKAVLHLISRHVPITASICEVGCGKGAFIDMLQRAGYAMVSGYDPTFEQSRPEITVKYVTKDDRIDADFIAMRHTLEHIHRPHQFVRMLADISNPDTEIYVEVPCFDWIRTNGAFFDITYEHVNYFTLDALKAMFGGKFSAAGHIFDGQYVYIIARLSDVSDRYAAAYDSRDAWQTEAFEHLFPKLDDDIGRLTSKLVEGGNLYIWGAGTKGCLFLHHAKQRGLPDRDIGFAVDINPGKIGTWLPGSGVAVKAPEDLIRATTSKDLIAISNPNYAAEIRTALVALGLGNIETICLS